jgi:hypothetical protein
MRQNVIVFFSLVVSVSAFAQDNKNNWNVNFGRSFHGGSFDLHGLGFEVFHEYRLAKHFILQNGLGFSMHFGTERFGTTVLRGNVVREELLHFTTAGLQAYSRIGFLFFDTNFHRLNLSVGPVARFQSRSVPVFFAFSPPTGPGFSNPSYYLYYENYLTLQLGYQVMAQYLVALSKSFSMGGHIVIQNDLQGDVITGFGLSLSAQIQ